MKYHTKHLCKKKKKNVMISSFDNKKIKMHSFRELKEPEQLREIRTQTVKIIYKKIGI